MSELSAAKEALRKEIENKLENVTPEQRRKQSARVQEKVTRKFNKIIMEEEYIALLCY